MKNLILALFFIGLSFPVIAQNSSSFYRSLSKQRSVHPTVRKASVGISKNFTIRDSLLYYTRSFERAVLQRRPAGNVKPDLVRVALKKYPGSSHRAVSSRLRMYATESNSRRSPRIKR